MNELLKNLGVIIIVIAAVVLILSHLLGWNNINFVQFGSFGAMIVGLALYIWLNKKYQLDPTLLNEEGNATRSLLSFFIMSLRFTIVRYWE